MAERPLNLMAEFSTPEALIAAARAARAKGYDRLDAFTPFPLPILAEILDFHDTAVGWGTLMSTLLGAALGWWLGWEFSAVTYVVDIGGKPPNSWPAFVLPAFETAVLLGAIGALGTMLVQCGLPRLHHPIFAVPGFERASDDRFFLLIEAAEPHTRDFLEHQGALAVTEVTP